MARFNRGMGLRPINSVKNIVDGTFLGVAAGVTTTTVLASGVNDYAGGVTEVPIGAKVMSIYLFASIQQTVVNSNIDWYIWKGPGNITATMPVPGVTGGDQNRKYILHEEKGLPGLVTNGAPPHIFRGVIRIPKGRQRFGEADRLEIKARGAGIYDYCIKAIYKFYQ